MDIDKVIFLTRELLHVIGEEILGERERKELSNSELAELFALLDQEEKYFHIEGRFLWNINEWKRSQERAERRKAIREKEQQIGWDREDVFKKLRFELEDQYGLDKMSAHVVALRMFHMPNIKGAAALGVDLANVPSRPYPTTYLDKEYGEYTL